MDKRVLKHGGTVGAVAAAFLLGSVSLGALTAVMLAYRNFFTAAHQLRELPA